VSIVNGREARNFGFFLGGVLIALSVYKRDVYETYVLFSLLGLGCTFGLMGFVCPKLIFTLRKGWLFLGKIMGRIMTPFIMGVLFVFLFVPVGIILRVLGKDILSLKFSKQAKTYWVNKNNLDSASMREQF